MTAIAKPSVPDAGQVAPLDLEALLHALRGHVDPAPNPPQLRTLPRQPAVLLEDGRRHRIDPVGSVADVKVFVDGVQRRAVLARRSHRGIWLTCAVAAAVTPTPTALKPCGARHSLKVMASSVDVDHLRTACGVDSRHIEVLDDADPDSLAAAAATRLGQIRAGLEQELVAGLLADTEGLVLVDGSLQDYPSDLRLLGL